MTAMLPNLLGALPGAAAQDTASLLASAASPMLRTSAWVSRTWTGGSGHPTADLWGLTPETVDGDLAFLAADGSTDPYALRLRRTDENRVDLVSFVVRCTADVDWGTQKLVADGVQLVGEPGLVFMCPVAATACASSIRSRAARWRSRPTGGRARPARSARASTRPRVCRTWS